MCVTKIHIYNDIVTNLVTVTVTCTKVYKKNQDRHVYIFYIAEISTPYKWNSRVCIIANEIAIR